MTESNSASPRIPLREAPPWPGPQPYEQKDWEIFFGRDSEIEGLVDKMTRQKLTVLRGPSGCGKTSLLRAGLVKGLSREKKSRSLRGLPANVPPVLILRNWGELRARDLKSPVGASVRAALLTYRTVPGPLVEDANFFGELAVDYPADQGLIPLVHWLRSRRSGIILIFDQFEEVLRADERLATEVCEAIALLFDAPIPDLHLLISVRDEYWGKMRVLELKVPDLGGRVLPLSPMRGRAALGAVQQAVDHANERGVTLRLGDGSPETAERLIRRIRDMAHGLAPNGGDTRTHDALPVDLLSLQAVLVDLYDNATMNPSGVVEFNDELLDRYRRARREVGLEALESWITKALAVPSGRDRAFEKETLVDDVVAFVSERLAENLALGDFKVSIREPELFYKSLSRELATLLLHPYHAVRIRTLQTTVETADWSGPEWRVNHSNLSGPMRDLGADGVSPLAELARVFGETIERLERKNILRRISPPGVCPIIELVHDQMGPAFTQWSRDRRITKEFEDAVSSFVVERGAPVGLERGRSYGGPGREQPLELRRLQWTGRWIHPLDVGEEQLVVGSVEGDGAAPNLCTLSDVVFDRCEFRGALFDHCRFERVRFKHCDLDGTIFKDCHFDVETPRAAERSSFEQCSGKGTVFLRGVLSNTPFTDCKFLQASFVGGSIVGEITVRGGEMKLTAFEGLHPHISAVGPPSPGFVFEGCDGAFNAWDEESLPFLRFAPDCRWSHSDVLPRRA